MRLGKFVRSRRSSEDAMSIRRALLTAGVTFTCLGIPLLPYAAPALPKVRVTVVSPDGSTKEVQEEVTAGQLVGDYSLGDGLGYNLNLVLKEGGNFECTWTGCLGVYGTARGQWAMQEDGLKLSPQMSEGILKDQPLDRLRLLSFQQNYLLVQQRDFDWFKQHGPDTRCCFHQPAARKALEQLKRRRIEEAVKILRAKSNE
jgi:hypothetical protein